MGFQAFRGRAPAGAAGASPDPLQLPEATGQAHDLTAYTALNVPGMAAGTFYADPVVGTKIWKATSATVPFANSVGMGHDYSDGIPFGKPSVDGKIVLFNSDMRGSGRYDLFVAEVPLS